MYYNKESTNVTRISGLGLVLEVNWLGNLFTKIWRKDRYKTIVKAKINIKIIG